MGPIWNRYDNSIDSDRAEFGSDSSDEDGEGSIDIEFTSDDGENETMVEEENDDPPSPISDPIFYMYNPTTTGFMPERKTKKSVNFVVDGPPNSPSSGVEELSTNDNNPLFLTVLSDGTVPRNSAMLGKAFHEYDERKAIGPVIRVGEEHGTAILI